MEEEHQIVNKIAKSSLITFDLEEYYELGERVLFDIKDQLYEGLLLREKSFREFVKNHDWTQYKNKFIAITCSTDAIVPTWAFMILAIALNPFAKLVIFGTVQDLEIEIFRRRLSKIEWSDFKDAKVVIKGCSKVEVPQPVYVEVVNRLMPYVNSLMFGEPCSTVPLFKNIKTVTP